MEKTMVNEMENVLVEEVLGNEEVVVQVVQKNSFGKNALIVAALAGAGIALYKGGKKLVAKRKAKHPDADITGLDKDTKSSNEDVIDVEVEPAE